MKQLDDIWIGKLEIWTGTPSNLQPINTPEHNQPIFNAREFIDTIRGDFEGGVEKLANSMQTMTLWEQMYAASRDWIRMNTHFNDHNPKRIDEMDQAEQETWKTLLAKKVEKIEFSETVKARYETLEKKNTYEITDLEYATRDLSINQIDAESRPLREAIGIDDLKQRMENAKSGNDIAEVEKITLEALFSIAREIHKYPYQLTEAWKGGDPGWILATKELYCVGYSILWHAFLRELGIKHDALKIPGHSALSVPVGNRNYLFDMQFYASPMEFVYDEWQGTNGYKKISILSQWEWKYPAVHVCPEEPHKNLPETIILNSAAKLFTSGKLEESLWLVLEYLCEDPQNFEFYELLWYILRDMWYQKWSELSWYITDWLIFQDRGCTVPDDKKIHEDEMEKIKMYLQKRDYKGMFDFFIRNSWVKLS